MSAETMYLDIVNNKVVAYANDLAMQNAGGTYKKEITLSEWEACKGLTKIVNNDIVLLTANDNEFKAVLANEFRNARRDKLRLCDKMNPMRWESYTDEQKQAWITYRQFLLDLPQQEGFPWNGPNEYQWPEPPEF